jgi:hypothetical protein
LRGIGLLFWLHLKGLHLKPGDFDWSKEGTIYEALLDGAEDLFKSTDRYLHPVFSMPEKQPITGLRFDMFPPLDPKKALVVATTPTRIYQFVGAPERKGDEGKVFTGLFASYRDATPSTFPRILRCAMGAY